MVTVLLMKPLIEVRANYGFIFLAQNQKGSADLCVIFKESQSGNIVTDVGVVLIFYLFVLLWYRSKVMCQQNVTLIFVWNIALITASARKYGERRWQNEITEL